MRRIARIVGGAFVLALVVGLATLVWVVRASLPRVGGTLALPGLTAPVTVIRDRAGVPHVFAESAADAQRALGFVQAQDRRLGLELTRRVALGRLAEVTGDGPLGEPLALGPVFATTALEADRQMRALGLARLAARALELMTAENRALLAAWADGVNAATESGAAGGMVRLLGVPIEPWTPLDSVAAYQLGAVSFAFGGWEERRTATLLGEVGERRLTDFLPPYPADWAPPLVDGPLATVSPPVPHALLALGVAGPAALPPLPFGAGSNNWVVSGRRSATGKPLLANDPHVGTNPPALYVAHVAAPGFEAMGTSVFGLGFYQGHNGRIAWGITLVGADTEDLFVEEIAPGDPPRRRTPTGWEPLALRREEIRVRGRSEVVTHVVRESSHGPLLYDVDPADQRLWLGDAAPPGATYAMALASTLAEPAPPDALLDLVRAADWAAFRAALRRYSGTTVNFVYADADGHIGYQMAGRIPRREGAAPLTPSPGWERGQAWLGIIPFDDLPSLLDPPEGVIVTANARITGPHYPHYIAHRWGDVPLRARRVRQLLDEKPKLTLDDMTAIQLDVRQERLAVLATWAGLGDGDDAEVRTLRDALAAWDTRATVDSTTAAMADAFRLELLYAVFAPALSPEAFDTYLWAGAGTHLLALERVLGDERAAFFGPEVGAARRARTAAVTRAVHAAIARLTTAMGPDRSAWRWGRIHTVTFVNPIAAGPLGPLLGRFVNAGPLAAPGSSFTVNAGWWPAARPFATWIAPMYRQVVDLGDLTRSRWTPPPPGASEHPLSSHARDLAEAWISGGHRPMAWTRAQVEADADTTLVLVPPR